MTTPLVTTKLYIPPPRPNCVPRQRLIERLSEGLQRKLTLISAPAGFGKTTLVAHWELATPAPTPALRTSPSADTLKMAWLSLDDDDNDPVRFWSYVIAALQTIDVGLGTDAQALLQARHRAPFKAIIATLVNSLSDLPNDLVLVLDDYHLITAEPIHEGVSYLLDHLPPRLHLIVTTRADPPLPLSRLRARGQLVELRAADLRFTPEEAAVFLNQLMGLGLSTEDVAALEARTEGWIAGLQMAALALQGALTLPGTPFTPGREDARDFIRSFTGTNRYILDYLTEEVLQHQTPEIRSFLLETCILDQLSGSLCDAVTHRSDSQTVLGQLDRANLFLTPLDDARKWYRYHRLFGDLLRGYLGDQQPDQVRELHCRASLWYEQNGFVSEAIGHALEAQDMERAADLVERAALSILMRNEMTTVGNWLKALPQAIVYSRPRLCVLSAGVAAFTGQMQAVEPLLQKAESQVPPDAQNSDSRDLLGQIRLIRAFRLVFDGDMPGAGCLASESLDYLSEGDLLTRNFATWIVGFAHYLTQDLLTANQALDTLERSPNEDSLPAVLSFHMRAAFQMLQGHLREAEQTFHQGMRIAEADMRRSDMGLAKPLSPGLGMIYQGLGELLRERNQLDEAERYLAQSVELSEQWGFVEVMADCYVALARVKRARGDWASAHDILGKAERLVQEHRLSPFTARQIIAHRARLWLAQGDVTSAAQWAASAEGPSETGENNNKLVAFWMHEVEQSTQARVLLAQHKFDQALDLLAPLVQAAEAGGWLGAGIELLALQALALDSQGHADAALASLQRALEWAEPEGHIRIFVDEGEPMRLLLQRMKDEGGTLRVKEYLGRLLTAFGEQPASADFHPSFPTPQPLVEPLSERELEVLRLIAQGDSNPEIAAKLVVAVSTVKTHVNNIFTKLGAQSRTQAVAHARELKLL
jgi:LuxR family maltose regulon positive regulatory protein